MCGGRDAELVGDYSWPVEYQLIGWSERGNDGGNE